MFEIRNCFTHIEDRSFEAGVSHATPLRRVAVAVVIENPLAGRGFQEDLTLYMEASTAIGEKLADLLVEGMGGRPVESYGKAGIVGMNGEVEHANMLMTTFFADPIRERIGGAAAWISSTTKTGLPGASIDVPLNHKDAIYVRSHYGTMTVTLASDVPHPDEVALIFCATSGGRLNARVGGLKHEDVKGIDGLR